MLEGVHQYKKIGLATRATMGGVMLQKCQEHSFVSDNACDTIAENWSARLDKSDSIQKRKQLENTYEKCARLLWNAFNVTYAVYLLHAHKCGPPGGVTMPFFS